MKWSLHLFFGAKIQINEMVSTPIFGVKFQIIAPILSTYFGAKIQINELVSTPIFGAKIQITKLI